VITIETNWDDRAEAETPEEAVLAARTMWDEALSARTIKNRPAVSFYVDGDFVRTTMSRIDLEGGF